MDSRSIDIILTEYNVYGRRVKCTGLETRSREPYVRIRFYVNTPCPAAARIFCGLVVNLQVALKSVALIEHAREHTPGKVIAIVNAFNQCTSDINEYPCCYSPVRLYATKYLVVVTP